MTDIQVAVDNLRNYMWQRFNQQYQQQILIERESSCEIRNKEKSSKDALDAAHTSAQKEFEFTCRMMLSTTAATKDRDELHKTNRFGGVRRSRHWIRSLTDSESQ